MKKIVFMIITVFLMSGCSAVYNLDIDSNLQTFKETTEVSTLNTATDAEYVKNNDWPKPIDYEVTGYSESKEKVDGVIYYNYETSSNANNVGFKYYYDFKRTEFLKSAAVHNCYNNISLNNNEGIYTLQTNKEFLCFQKYPLLEDVQINITTQKPVIMHNANSVNKNTYTWNLTKENANNSMISISFDMREKIDGEDNSQDLKIVLITLGCFIIVIFAIIIYKNHKYNRN